MFQIFLNDHPTQLFFSLTSSRESIIEHLSELVMFDSRNIFNLNEQRSCSVSPSLIGDIHISGDEDSKILTIEKVKPIKL